MIRHATKNIPLNEGGLMESGLNKVVAISLALILFATMGMTAFGILGTSDTAAVVDGESFTTTVWGAAVNLAGSDIVSNTVVVYNGTDIVLAASNYSIGYTAGTITPTVNGTLANATAYTIDYHHSPIDSSVTTLLKVVCGLVAALVIIIIFLKAAGIKIDA